MKHCCSQIVELLVDYLEGELSAEQTAELDSHFAGCPPCVAFLETYRETGKVCKCALEKELPAAMEQTLLNFLKTTIQG
ncbi:MAG: zf-HC2 domain-containing protein [Bradymonadaceae bacterium]|nr:zf-HC2 domain-containing protein [Lujinxingiaceae bacterium]